MFPLRLLKTLVFVLFNPRKISTDTCLGSGTTEGVAFENPHKIVRVANTRKGLGVSHAMDRCHTYGDPLCYYHNHSVACHEVGDPIRTE